jgi:rare lipoprotein A
VIFFYITQLIDLQAKERKGVITYYAHYFQGRKTSSGERYQEKKMTAAHPTLPFGTKIKITNPVNSKSVVVKINDRCVKTRGVPHFDVSYSAAKKLDIIRAGRAHIQYTILTKNDKGYDIDIEEKDSDSIKQSINEEIITTDNTIIDKHSQIEITPNPVLKPYCIQIGAFNDKNNAISILKKVEKKGLSSPLLVDNRAKNQPMAKYFVTVGDFDTYKSAKKYLTKVKSKNLNGFVVQRSQI